MRVGRTLADVVKRETDGWGADVVFECSGNEQVAPSLFESICPGGASSSSAFRWSRSPMTSPSGGQGSAGRAFFRYAHVFPRCVAMLGSGDVDVKPLITKTFGFEDSIRAFEFATKPPTGSVKVQIEMPS